MPNMSYCRWGNTALAMTDCVNSLADGQLDDIAGLALLDQHEQSGVLNALALAAQLLETVSPAILAEAGIDMSRLPSQDMIRNAGRRTLPRAA